MKKFMPVIVILLVLTLTACTKQNTPSTSAGRESLSPTDSIINLDAGVWPDNEYTAGLPVPPGIVRWAMLDTTHQNCSVNLTGMDESNYQAYLEALEQAGFSVIQEASEEIEGADYTSAVVLLTNGEKGLSISHIPDGLTIYISFERK